MGCLRCGCLYMTVVGKELHCPKCGHIQGGEMPDNADFIEQCELDIWQIIAKMHKNGVRYAIVQFILSDVVKTLELQGYCEDWLGKYMPKESQE